MPNHQSKYHTLRQSYPEFVYEGFTVQELPEGILAEYQFSCGEAYTFRPTVLFKRNFPLQKLSNATRNLLLFHIGMVECISYWKAFCSPILVVKPFIFCTEQELWWKKLFRHGLGEFFYTNGIAIPGDEIFTFKYPDSAQTFEPVDLPMPTEGVIVPVGGGKDSVVTLEILLRSNFDVLPLVMNQRDATREVLKVAGFDDTNTFEINRTIDPLLLQLNKEGFLNGHTPFSALLAFHTVMVAALSGRQHIALSNEWSANEATIPGTLVNHQYSKSLEFESDFRCYINKYMVREINYFSMMRPINELQIGKLFAKFDAYHSVFKSCNVGSKTDIWCCECSKCLFTWIILSPFLNEDALEAIFGKNLWDNPQLIDTLQQLCGLSETKPFECVGTIDEVNAALSYTLSQYSEMQLPVLLNWYAKNGRKLHSSGELQHHLETFHHPNFLNAPFEAALKSFLFPAKAQHS